ncbi:hypothetical protein LLEC1_02778 [Akanthomyces lecanii]|uniref:DUF4097 domain-containing protein n=1 Tax=Cordyceps confragosa TaxID=2714763 RepID=A0A179I9T6_CORDF|nr:hypothetical protein LLEC1_02778 [Akanthomyces lecanii]
MHTLISLPLTLGSDRSLDILQKPKSGGLFRTVPFLPTAFRSGALHIQQVPAGAPAVLDICATKKYSYKFTNDIINERQSIVIHTSSWEPVQIYLRWPKDAGLDRLQVVTAEYSIKSDIAMPSVPGGATHLSPADVDFVPARELFLSSRSGAITGLFPSHDVLDVFSSSGSTSLTLLPLFDKPSHAGKVVVRSNSGTLNINGKLDADAAASRVHFPSRNSSVTIITTSGSIRAVLGLTKSVTIRSSSGSQNITALLSDHSHDRRSDFVTASSSGTQSITVVSAAQLDKTESSAVEKTDGTGFVCKHSNRSGSVRIAYPGEWEGTVEAHSYSGSISVTGEGVDMDRAHHRVTGVKGTPEHHTDVGTSSGSISVNFGSNAASDMQKTISGKKE